jgi:hypothetical protein
MAKLNPSKPLLIKGGLKSFPPDKGGLRGVGFRVNSYLSGVSNAGKTTGKKGRREVEQGREPAESYGKANAKAEAFKTESQKYDTDVIRITQINTDLLDKATKSDELVKEVAQENVITLDGLGLFLVGSDGISGYIDNLQRQKTELIPDDLKTDSLDSYPTILLNNQAAIL